MNNAACKLDTLGKELVISDNFELAMRARRAGRVWYVGSATNIWNFPLIDGVQKLLIATGPSEESIEAAETCCRRYQHDGRQARHLIKSLTTPEN